MRKTLGVAILAVGACWLLVSWRGGQPVRFGEHVQLPPLVEAAPQSAYGSDEARDIAIYKRVSPSVVNITSQIISFDLLFGPVPESGQGSGFFIDAQGDILTNYHVIRDARQLKVTWTPQRGHSHAFDGRVVGAAQQLDLAVIRATGGGPFPPATLGDSGNLQVGEDVLAIGNPYGLPGSMTRGIISSIRTVTEGDSGVDIEDAIQTDAPINPGNSGGPLLNSQGEVIGLDTMIYSETGSNVGIGFAIPVNAARAVLQRLLTTGGAEPADLGIRQQVPVSSDLAQQLNLPVDHGVLILAVTAGGTAAQAGLRGGAQPGYYGRTPVQWGGDIITAVNGESVRDYSQLSGILLLRKPGSTVTLTVQRGRQSLEIKLPVK